MAAMGLGVNFVLTSQETCHPLNTMLVMLAQYEAIKNREYSTIKPQISFTYIEALLDEFRSARAPPA